DVTGVFNPRALRHTILMGAELGRQRSDNFRNTAFFDNNATSINVPFEAPTISSNAIFRQAASDADNFATNYIAATYVQDQIELTRHIQVVAALRYDRFNIDFHNNRTNENL